MHLLIDKPEPLFANSLIIRRALLIPLEEGFRQIFTKSGIIFMFLAFLIPLEEGFRQFVDI